MRKASTFARGKSQYRGVTKHKVAPRNATSALSKPSLTPLSTPSRTLITPASTPMRIQVQCFSLLSAPVSLHEAVWM